MSAISTKIFVVPTVSGCVYGAWGDKGDTVGGFGVANCCVVVEVAVEAAVGGAGEREQPAAKKTDTPRIIRIKKIFFTS